MYKFKQFSWKDFWQLYNFSTYQPEISIMPLYGSQYNYQQPRSDLSV